MKQIASGFSSEMDRINQFLDLINRCISLAKAGKSPAKSRQAFIAAANNVAKYTSVMGNNLTLLAYDGTYLRMCAEFELSMRQLIEKYVYESSTKCANYNHLPKEIREWYPEGCSLIILNLNQDKFKHLTKDAIIRSLAGCANSPTKAYSLIGEAFSDNPRNFWAKDIDNFFSHRIGIPKIWQKLSREKQFKIDLGTSTEAVAEQQGRLKIDNILHRRNDIIYRGKTYYAPSESEIRDCSGFLKTFTTNLAVIMTNHLASL